MTTAIYTDPNRRHDFVLLFDVTDGNPNGDPDAGNLPRVDPETMQGLVTDVCLKRKVRNWIDANHGQEASRKIYVQSRDALNTIHQRAYDHHKIKPTGAKQKREDVDKTRGWMCANFYDVRMFGAVMTTSINCGQVRGPIQLTFARSLDAVVPLDLSITRIAITRPEDLVVVAAEEGDEKKSNGQGKVTEMGRKALLPYALFRCHGFFTPHFAKESGATADDLALFWDALQHMWELDRSAGRGLMSLRGLYIFSHENGLGNAPAHALFERIQTAPLGESKIPRHFAHYKDQIHIDDQNLPEGVALTRLVG